MSDSQGTFIVDEKVGAAPLGGNGKPDGKLAKYFGTTAQKLGWIAMIILLTITVVYSRSVGFHPLDQFTAQAPGNPGTLSSQASLQAGVVTVTSDGITTISLKPGQSLCSNPRCKVAYERYVNGVLVCRIPADGPTVDISPYVGEVQTVSFRLSAGSPVQFAYVKYYGATPPDNWYNEAIAHSH